MPKPTDDSEVVARCQRELPSCHDAFDILLDRYENQVYTLCLRITGDASDAEDLMQEVFTKVFFKIKGFQGRAAFSSWLYRIAYNHCLNFLQHRKRRRELTAEFVAQERRERLGRTGPLRESMQLTLDRLAPETRSLILQALDRTQTQQVIRANHDFQTGKAFSPALLREGAGVNVRLLRQRESFVDWRGGVGLRQNRFNGALVREEGSALVELITGQPPVPVSSANGALLYREVESFNQAGLETTVVATASINRLLINSSFDLFGEFDDLGEPSLDWRNTFSWRLTGNLSVDYTLDMLRIPQVIKQTQTTQSLLFRYSWGS